MATKKRPKSVTSNRPVCGLVMPISPIDGCTESHWAEVRRIHSEAAESAGFEVRMVSDADDVGVIQKRIIQNLYDNPIIICDVSARNSNVMFELGMRLAFDKPTVIVKDDKTDYSFDTSPIEHVPYRRDLRYSDTLEFRSKLTAKIKSTHESATSDASFSPFLKAFGTFKVAKIAEEEVSPDKYLIEEVAEIKQMLQSLVPSAAAKPLRAGFTMREIELMRSFVAGTRKSGGSLTPNELASQLRLKHPIFREIARSAIQNRLSRMLKE